MNLYFSKCCAIVDNQGKEVLNPGYATRLIVTEKLGPVRAFISIDSSVCVIIVSLDLKGLGTRRCYRFYLLNFFISFF